MGLWGDLGELIVHFQQDPLGFVKFAYPWGEAGTPLEHETGPDSNQAEFLESLGQEIRQRHFDGQTAVMPIRMAETSGHGTGKSAMGAWITDFILSTRPFSKGTVTAGTYTQLETRTWAAIQYWTRMCITAPMFEIQASGIYAKGHKENWYVSPQTCREENAQSFAGQHARDSTSWYLFDEASVVPEKIWQVAYGGLTDGEPMFFAWGQPERNSGEFYNIAFGAQAHRWNHRTVDSRTSRFTNKELIEEWRRDYGEQSDWYRVRVLGLPPYANELQFIDSQRIAAAETREVFTLSNEPLIAGVDVSGGGAAWNVVRFRRGLDARTVAPVRIPGEATRNSRDGFLAQLAGILAESGERHVTMMFFDSAFGAPYVERLKVLGYASRVMEVSFGAASLEGRGEHHYANRRAYMWDLLKEWLLRGAISPRDHMLSIQLGGPGYHINTRNQLVLESKEDMRKRGIGSPDDADALALTFAQPVLPEMPVMTPRNRFSQARSGTSWTGL